jgi:hypothetical protein
LFALKRFDDFKRKVSENGQIKGKFNENQVKGYCLKADIKHYYASFAVSPFSGDYGVVGMMFQYVDYGEN